MFKTTGNHVAVFKKLYIIRFDLKFNWEINIICIEKKLKVKRNIKSKSHDQNPGDTGNTPEKSTKYLSLFIIKYFLIFP